MLLSLEVISNSSPKSDICLRWSFMCETEVTTFVLQFMY